MVVMPTSLRVGEDLIRFHNVLEGGCALWTYPIRVIEFGEFPVGT
jgi:hypothetical protein